MKSNFLVSANPESIKQVVFCKEYNVLSSLGEGTTAKVYLAQKIADPSEFVAIKLFREEFIR